MQDRWNPLKILVGPMLIALAVGCEKMSPETLAAPATTTVAVSLPPQGDAPGRRTKAALRRRHARAADAGGSASLESTRLDRCLDTRRKPKGARRAARWQSADARRPGCEPRAVAAAAHCRWDHGHDPGCNSCWLRRARVGATWTRCRTSVGAQSRQPSGAKLHRY